MPSPIYLDYQASTPVDQRVLDAMLPFLREGYGNASSAQHEPGRQAAAAVEQARSSVAALLGSRPQEIVFTSGATEANNLALRGLADGCDHPGHIISCTTEHPAVLAPLRALERVGWSVTYLQVDRGGEIDLKDIDRNLREETALVSLMMANNELGTLHPLEAVSALAHRHGVPVHTDAAQAVGKVMVGVDELGIDLLSLSGHKLYAPQGVGALYVRRQGAPSLNPLLRGGGQERGLRGGTPNVPGIVGLGAAAELAARAIGPEAERLTRQRDRLEELLRDGDPDMLVNGAPPPRRLPACLHLTFPGADADAVMANCPEVAMASGSACSSAAPGPSHVLSATGMSPDLAEASLRLSLGRFTTDREVEEAARRIVAAVTRVRRVAGVGDHAPTGVTA